MIAIQHGLDLAEKRYGPGAVAGVATEMARNFNGFEILIGPYAVSHLRVTEAIMGAGGSLPANGVHVYLTDTLEAPTAEGRGGQLTLQYKPLSDEHQHAQNVKQNVRVLVCMGNPPYDRQVIDPGRKDTEQRKGGWVRFGDDGKEGILDDFLAPVRLAGQGVHAKNLYNDYVYFWRWALWKVFETSKEGGIVSFITASSYLSGPGFIGMRQKMRELLDELWIIDLEGDNLGARKTENVFNIQTPVAIAIGVRYGKPKPNKPAKVHYAKITGSRQEKLSQLKDIQEFTNLVWKRCFSGLTEPFLPPGKGDFFSWPKVIDVFPLQFTGVEMKRTWPIGETHELLLLRWDELLRYPPGERGAALRETPARTAAGSYGEIGDSNKKLPPIDILPPGTPPPEPRRYGFRSFDRQWVMLDSRLSDRPRPKLWNTYSEQQVYLTSMLTGILGNGPASIVTGFIPDRHHFRGSYSGKDIVPLYRDPQGTSPNIASGVAKLLEKTYGSSVKGEDLFAYAYALLASPTYVNHFSEELTIPGPRLPITKNHELFEKAASLGRKLIWLHTYGERFIPKGEEPGSVPQGNARNTGMIPDTSEAYPESFSYEPGTRTLHVGEGSFAPVSKEVWGFSVSGLEVVKSWLSYRMKAGAGRKSSPLDDIRPERWTSTMTKELLELIWVLEATVTLFPEMEALLDEIVTSELFAAIDLPEPTDEERKPPAVERHSQLNMEQQPS